MLFEGIFHGREIRELSEAFPEISPQEIKAEYNLCRGDVTPFLQGIRDRRLGGREFNPDYGIALVVAATENLPDRIRQGMDLMKGSILRFVYA